jgi:hypothetical protein
MNLLGTMPVRNEGCFLGLTLRAALLWCDAMVVGLHACTDDSEAIVQQVAEENPGRIHLVFQPESEWVEMAQRQRLLERARQEKATHIAIVDADEVLAGCLLSDVRSWIEHSGFHVLQMPWICLARSLHCFYASGIWSSAWVTMAFRDRPELHWAARNGYDFHHRHPMGTALSHVRSPRAPAYGGLMHLQFVDERRLRAKQALYKITEVLRWPGRSTVEQINELYNPAVYQSDPSRYRTFPVTADWWGPYSAWLQHLHIEREPWQAEEVRRLVAEHGREKFAGLDLFGLVP